MKFKLEIELTNAAFTDDPNELSRILSELAESLEQPEWTPHEAMTKNLRDLNGNTVGNYEITEEG